MIAHRIRGRIVNISTIGAHGCHKDAAVYDSAKGAVETMTRNMALELAPHGIGVNCVIPGAIWDVPARRRNRSSGLSPLGASRSGASGSQEDIAAAVRFFCLPPRRSLQPGNRSSWTARTTPISRGLTGDASVMPCESEEAPIRSSRCTPFRLPRAADHTSTSLFTSGLHHRTGVTLTSATRATC